MGLKKTPQQHEHIENNMNHIQKKIEYNQTIRNRKWNVWCRGAANQLPSHRGDAAKAVDGGMGVSAECT